MISSLWLSETYQDRKKKQQSSSNHIANNKSKKPVSQKLNSTEERERNKTDQIMHTIYRVGFWA
jgi:hypothetical protein